MSSVLIVSSEFPPQPGGIGNHAFNLARHLCQAGFRVEVVTDQRSETGADESLFDTQQDFEIHRIKKRDMRVIMYVQRIIKTFTCMKRSENCIASGKFSLWNVALGRLFYKINSVAVLHGTEVNFKPVLLRTSIKLALKQFDQLIAVSQYTKNLVKLKHKTIKVVPNGIQLSDWQRHQLGQKNQAFAPNLVTLGRISDRKGQKTVIRSLPFLLQKFPNLHYHCVGLDTDKADCVELANNLNVLKHVTFYGVLGHSDLIKTLCKMDLFVMLSQETASGDVEGFGIAILEANALGIPAVGAKGSGVEEAIKHKETGFLISKDDPQEFEEAISVILEDYSHYASKARSWAESHDWNAIVQSYKEVLQ